MIMIDQLKIEPTARKREDDLAGDGRVLEGEEKTAGRENLQEVACAPTYRINTGLARNESGQLSRSSS